MAVKVFSSQVVGLKADVIDVEVDLTNGLHSFSLVGLPDKAVEESKDRVCAAIKIPASSRPKPATRKWWFLWRRPNSKKKGRFLI